MSVSAQETVFRHVGNGVTVTFPFGCQVPQAADLSVYLNEALITTGFTVSGIGSLTGGSVTFDAAPANLAAVRIERDIELERSTVYQQNGDFLSRVVNPDFDRLWMGLQQQSAGLRRVLKVPASDATEPSALPNIAERADKLLSFDATGNPIAVYPAAGTSTALQLLLSIFSGSALIGFLQAGVGAVGRTVFSKLKERVSVTDFMTEAERADCLTGSPVMDVTGAFMAAIAAANVVEIPDGTYLVGNIKVNKNNFTLRGSGYNRCTLLAIAAAQITIEVATTNSVSFLVLEGFKIQGNVTALGGIKLGSSDANYCAGAMLNRVGSWDFSRSTTTNGYGVQLACVQNLSIHNCWIYRNRHNYQRLPGTGYATSVHITGKTGYAGEGYVGVYIDSQIDDIYIDDIAIEGNSNSGIIITANAVSAGKGTNLYINGAYVESNNATGAGVILMTGGAAAYQNHVLVMDRVNFAINTGFYVVLDKVTATIRGCKLAPAQVSTTAATSVRFDSNKYPTAADYLTTYRALAGNIVVTDTNDPATGTTANQINLVNAIQFPLVERPVDDNYTLTGYRRIPFTPVLSSDLTPPTYTNIDTPEGVSIKIGDFIFIRVKMRVSITVAGTGNPRLTGMPVEPKGLEPPIFGLTTALNAVPTAGLSYMVAGPAMLIASTYKITADGYIVFTCMYPAT